MKEKPINRELQELQLGELYGDVQNVTRIFYLFISLALIGLVFGIVIVLANDNTLSAILLAITAVPVSACLYLVRARRFETAAIFLGGFLIVMNTILATTGLGIRSLNIIAFPVILIIASLVTSKRHMFFLTFLTVLCISWLVFGELWGLYSPRMLVRSVPGDFFSASMIVILTAIMVHRLTGSMFQSFSRVQKEVAERRSVEDDLRQRETILEAVTFAAEQFLKTSDWRENINSALERLGKTTHATHAYLFEDHLNANGELVTSMRYEWTAPGYPSDLNGPYFQDSAIHQEGFDEQVDLLRRGEARIGNSSTFNPIERDVMAGHGVKAILEVPIFVSGREWGAIGFDDFENERDWSIAEVDALKIAAGILSAAIQRQEAESAIRESERIYRQAIQASGMVPYYRDYVQGRYTFIGDGIEKMIGYKPEEITPELFLEIMKENVPLEEGVGLDINDAVYRARSGKMKEWRSDMMVIARNGEERWLSDSAVELFNDAELSYASVGILHDVTDRKRTEAVLRKRESLLESITFSAEQFLKTPDWRERINAVLERLGREFNASHAYLFEKHAGPAGEMLNSMRYEWVAPGQKPDIENPAYQNAPELEMEFKHYYEILGRGEPFVGSSSLLLEGERTWFNNAGIRALLEMRIVVNGMQWGTLGFDDTLTEREWTALEVDVLKVAVNVLGAAIKRQLDEDALKNELSERRRAERALRLSEEKFSKAFHTTHVMMTIENDRNVFVDANQAFLDVFGLQREDIIGRTGSQLNLFYDPLDAQALNREFVEKGYLRDYETKFRGKDGKVGVVLISSEKIFLDEVEYTLTSGLDITERKRVEQEIRQHAMRAEVLASLSHLLTQTSQDYHLMMTMVVGRCAELIGDGASIFSYAPDKEFLELVAVYNPDDEAVQIFRDELTERPIKWNEGAYAKAIGENQPVLIPFIDVDELIKRSPPERRSYYQKLPIHSMMLAPLHVHGKVLGVIGMARHSPGRDYTPDDLTFLQDIADRSALAMLNAQYYRELEQELAERRRLERELQEERDFALQVINSLGQGLTVTNENGRFLLVNPAFANLIGYEPDDLIGKNPAAFTLAGSQEILEKARIDRKKGITSTYESDLKHKDGKSVPVLITGAPRLKDGKYTGSISSVTDLTQIKWAQEERERLITELSAKNTELEQFTYTVSHDLKSPLVTINGFLGYLEQDAMAGNIERLKKDSQRIHEAVQKMQRLLNELLELSRIGRMMNAPETIPFLELVEEALDIVHGRLEERGVTVHVHQNLSPVYGDRPRLIEVLQNLIDNATKYMGDQPDPLIEIGQRGGGDGLPVFYVRDNGMGIAPEHHERVFGLFNKLDAKSEGTGVGLALVKRIIDVHGGRIWIESEVGQGTTFYFSLPSGNAGKKEVNL